MSRKTMDVSKFIDWANGILAMDESDVITSQHKQGIIHALDQVLLDTGNYNGFRYLDTYDEYDPEFAINGRKNNRRMYFKKSTLLR